MIILLTAIVLSITSVVIWFLIHKDVGSSGQTTNAAPIITDVNDDQTQKLHVDERLFSLDLPLDWKLQTKDTIPFVYWTWVSTKKNADNRTLILYVDGSPPNQAVNQLLPLLKSTESSFNVGSLSNQCNDFTPAAQAAAKANQTVPSRWQGVNFICDAANPINQAIGTGSMDGLNMIRLTGASGGTHTYFFLYLDHNIHPDSSILTDALTSFKVK